MYNLEIIGNMGVGVILMFVAILFDVGPTILFITGILMVIGGFSSFRYLKGKNEKKNKLWKDSKKPFWILFGILAFMIFMDGMVTTPIALVCVDDAYEANLWHQQWSNTMGVKYFYLSGPIIVFFFLFALYGVDAISYKVSKKFFPRYIRFYHWTAYLLTAVLIIGFGSTVINNFEVILHGI